MCGIAGVFARSGTLGFDASVVEGTCRRIVYRGPDDLGVFMNGSAQIGMRHPSIIDLSSGHQPIHNEDRSVWIVVNGEIYNCASLRRELEAVGHCPYTRSDTECIVHVCEQHGEGRFVPDRFGHAAAACDPHLRALQRSALAQHDIETTDDLGHGLVQQQAASNPLTRETQQRLAMEFAQRKAERPLTERSTGARPRA
jgi:hypothetical protein